MHDKKILEVKNEETVLENSYGFLLKKILTETEFQTKFYFEGVKEIDTSKDVEIALHNLRLYLKQGAWTKNDFERFVILNINLTSAKIVQLYRKKQYKESSVRTYKLRALEKLQIIIKPEYLDSFLLFASTDMKEKYMYQREACKYFRYLNSNFLSKKFLPDEILDILGQNYQGTEKYSISDCQKELRFLSLFCIANLSNIVGKLDSSKLGYLYNILSASDDFSTYRDNFEFFEEFSKSTVRFRKEVFEDLK